MKVILFFGILCFLSSCTKTEFVEKHSKALSVSVYAAKDSLDLGRIDLTEPYLSQICKIVPQPSEKDRIKISPIMVGQDRKIVVPSKYKGQEVIVVGSKEYNELIKLQNVTVQLQNDNNKLLNQNKEVLKQLNKEQEVTNKMILEIKQKDEIIKSQKKSLHFKNSIIAVLSLLFVWYKFFRR